MSIASLSKKDQTTLKREEIEQRYKLWRTLVRWAAVICCTYFLKDALFELAGKETALALSLAFLGDFKFAATLTLAGGAAAWAIVERMLRNRKTEYMSDRIKKLEIIIDRDRSSSGLTKQGKTNPRDK